ncbi:MAG: hypothetical protein ACRD2Z_03270 [Thermoanaerobaculia bacterium]
MTYRTPLDKILTEEGRTGSWLARCCGVSRQAVSLWRVGRSTPEQATAERAARCLERKVGELFAEYR